MKKGSRLDMMEPAAVWRRKIHLKRNTNMMCWSELNGVDRFKWRKKHRRMLEDG